MRLAISGRARKISRIRCGSASNVHWPQNSRSQVETGMLSLIPTSGWGRERRQRAAAALTSQLTLQRIPITIISYLRVTGHFFCEFSRLHHGCAWWEFCEDSALCWESTRGLLQQILVKIRWDEAWIRVFIHQSLYPLLCRLKGAEVGATRHVSVDDLARHRVQIDLQ